MFEMISSVGIYTLPFLILLTILVFVHELGHYGVARMFGVNVETFSIGFGRAIYSWKDRAGTQWKIGWLPLGGYVKFLGDEDASSVRKSDRKIDAGTKGGGGEKLFHDQPLYARVAVVAAGPLANFLFAIVILTIVFATVGQSFTPPVIDTVIDNTAASEAGLRSGDRIVNIDGQSIERFEELQIIIATSPGFPLDIQVERDGVALSMVIVPGTRTFEDRFGNTQNRGFLGVSRGGREHVRHGPVAAIWYATRETYRLSVLTLINVGRMISGSRPADELRGIIGIAQISGQAAQMGFESLLGLTVIISIGLGLINLFPIPVLDGGHLVFYAYEAVAGKPLGERAQEFFFRIGLVLVITLMLFALWNDLVRLDVFENISRIFS
jgi:regulator of sigma E protease